MLYRETESESGGGMSDRKRLDIKGAMQFVDRYVGGKDYKAVMLSGDGVDLWKPVAEKEAAPIPVETWEAGKLCGLKDNDSAALLAAAAALRGRTGGPASPDISGVSTAANLERQVQSYVWNITFVLGGLLLLLTLLAQGRLLMASSKVATLRARVMNVPELNGMDAGTIRGKIDDMQVSAQTLDVLVSEVDPLAPKLAAIADHIPSDLWVGVITYTNPFNFSEGQSGLKELRISGSTYTRGEVKGRLVDNFTKALKAAEEFKVYTPPMGGIDSTTESAAPTGPDAGGFQPAGRMTSEFSVMCTRKRK